MRVNQYSYFLCSKIIELYSKKPLGHPFIELDTAESTNNYAMGLVHKGRLPEGQGMVQHGTTVFAHNQTKGRGQREKSWESEPGKNIALSVILQPQGLSTSQFFLLSKAVSLALCEVLTRYGGKATRIKWPNDIFWNDRKAAGILIENVIKGSRWNFAVVGIGINVNQTDFGSLQQQAVSLKQITGKDHNVLAISHEVLNALQQQYERMFKLPAAVEEGYRNQLYKLNDTVKLKQGSRVFDAVIKDVTSRGQLVVQHAVEETFDVGEVEFLISGL